MYDLYLLTLLSLFSLKSFECKGIIAYELKTNLILHTMECQLSERWLYKWTIIRIQQVIN